jgi:hypothetical protein
MKLDQLRKIIREEVRAAVKEELQDVMNEAVKHASTPYTAETPKPKDTNLKWSVPPKKGKTNLDEMLQMTANEMTSEDANQISGAGNVKKPNFASMMSNKMVRENTGPMPGLDISKLDFVSKAKSVLDASMKKDKARLG